MNKATQSTNAIAKIISKYYDIQKLEKNIKLYLLIASLSCFGMLLYHVFIETINYFKL